MVVLGGSASAAPQLVRTLTGAQPQDQFGTVVAGVGDCDGDGYPDWAVGVPESDAGGLNAGRVHVYSGREGNVLMTLTGAAGDKLGWAVDGVGDWDEDGYDDVLIGSPYHGTTAVPFSGRAQVVSGKTQAVLFEVTGASSQDRLGYSVAGAGDVNADGRVDALVGSPYESSSAGRARVYSSLDGSVLHTLSGGTGGLVGWSVAGVGDLDADGFDDVLVGEPWSNAAATNAGRATVFSGQDGSVLRTHDGDSAAEYFGRWVARLGYVDGDAVPDYGIAAPYDSAIEDWAGSVRVISGVDGSELMTVHGDEADQRFGWSFDGPGDMDQDGADDLLVGLPGEGTSFSSLNGRFRMLSGADGSLMASALGAASDELGSSVAGTGDMNGDGLPDFVIGSPQSNKAGFRAGEVDLWSGGWGELFWSSYCTGVACPCGNDYPTGGCLNSIGTGAYLGLFGSTSVSEDTTGLGASGLVPGKAAVLFVGTQPKGGGFGVPFGDGLSCAGGGIVRLGVVVPQFSGASWGPGLRAKGQWSAGDTRYFQVWYRDAVAGPCGKGTNLSSAVQAHFIP